MTAYQVKVLVLRPWCASLLLLGGESYIMVMKLHFLVLMLFCVSEFMCFHGIRKLLMRSLPRQRFNNQCNKKSSIFFNIKSSLPNFTYH